MNNKLSLFVFLLISCGLRLNAQTVKWAVSPSMQYQKSEAELMKGKNSAGKTMLMYGNGKQLIDETYDSITDFYNGFALALIRENDRYRIKALINQREMEVETVSETVYASRFPYFSEGKMPVEGEEGWGYLGTDGNMAIPCSFQKAYPFSKGLAVVRLKEKEYYINSDVDYLSVNTSYPLVHASTFNGDEALVITDKMVCYYINRQGRATKARVKASDVVRNSDHTVGEPLRLPHCEQIQSLPPVDSSYQLFQEGEYWGYRKDGDIVAPAQFDKAEEVRGGYASVVYNGQPGSICFVNGSVSASLLTSSAEVKTDGSLINPLRFQVLHPSSFQDSDVRLYLIGRNGDLLKTELQTRTNSTRTYTASIPGLKAGTDENLLMVILSDGLILWNGVETLHVGAVKSGKPAPKPTPSKPTPSKPSVETPEKKPARQLDKKEKAIVINETKESTPVVKTPAKKPADFVLSPPRGTNKNNKANPKDEFLVSVNVRNVGEVKGNVDVYLTVKSSSYGKKNISVGPGKNAVAIFKIPNVKKEMIATGTAKLSNGKTSSGELHLLPFW